MIVKVDEFSLLIGVFVGFGLALFTLPVQRGVTSRPNINPPPTGPRPKGPFPAPPPKKP